jgi:hypothetical protein
MDVVPSQNICVLDIETGSNIEPNPERVYIANEGLSDALPTCDYCLYTTSPPDDDFRILRRSGKIFTIALDRTLVYVEMKKGKA